MATAALLSTLEKDTPIKYLLLTRGASYFPSLMRPELERAGLYNWPKVFDGDVELWKRFEGRAKHLKKYDIIHVNQAGGDFGLVTQIRKAIGEDARTKLVTNMDYSVHYYSHAFKSNSYTLTQHIADLHAADMVFGVEPHQVALMDFIMKTTKKEKRSTDAALLTHPVNVEVLSRPMPDGMFAPYDNRGDILAYQYHRYDGHWHIAKLITHELPPPQFGGTVLRACLGFTDDQFATCDMPELVMPFIVWAKYIYFLSTCLWGFEYRTHSAASRFIMECASLGIPVVSTDYSYLGKQLFPELTFPMSDYNGMREALSKLITDDSYRVRLASEGLMAVKPYGFEHAVERFMMELNNRCQR